MFFFGKGNLSTSKVVMSTITISCLHLEGFFQLSSTTVADQQKKEAVMIQTYMYIEWY